MRLGDFDIDSGDGSRPIAAALLWLETLINAPSVPWSPGQRKHAQGVLERARFILTTDVRLEDAEDGSDIPPLIRVVPDPGSRH